MNTKQQIQESEYNIPYHYIPQFEGEFSEYIYWGWGLNYISALEQIIDILNDFKPGSVCDVGAGDGRLVAEIAKKFPDIPTVGIDYSDKAITIAKALNPRLEFHCLNIIDESVDLSFDAITLIEVLEHIPLSNLEDFIRSIHRLLNKGGLLIVTVPHKNLPLIAKHFQHFTTDSLSEVLNNYFKFKTLAYIQKKSWCVKVLKLLLHNPLFILNHKEIKNRIYRIYKKKFFFTSESKCTRILAVLEKD